MSLIFLLLLASFVTYRATRFLIADSMIEVTRGRFLNWLWPPPDFTADIAALVANAGATPKAPTPPSFLRRKLYELVTCPYCLSIWLGGAATLIVWVFYPIPLPGLWPLALSTGSLILWRFIEDN